MLWNDLTDSLVILPFIEHQTENWPMGMGRTPNNFRGGANIPLPPPLPPNNPPTFSFNFYVKQENITNVPSWRVKY